MEWFIINAYISGILASVLCGISGYYVVMRQEIFLLHALSHIGLPGIMLGSILGFSPYIGQLLCIFFFCMALTWQPNIQQDLHIGMLIGLIAGFSNLLMSIFPQVAPQINFFFFGNIFCVSEVALYWQIGLTVLAIISFIYIHPQLLFMSLEPEIAASQDIHMRKIRFIFYLILSVAIVISVHIIGNYYSVCSSLQPLQACMQPLLKKESAFPY